ncbi:enoyl-CoA hydratase-related protein [Shewanella marina]|uniref:enoyl-CoA hydratase-related protein n=1 Tax=Shewanella marina TaxID=487319 RepID=UPI00047123FC|nr:enoyl-CoA hydratase-related protein [Shewanella marina]
MTTQFEHVQLQIDAGVAALILNRIAVHNAFDDQMISEMISALAIAADDPQVQVLLLKANGKHFSAGADLNWMQRQAQMDMQQNVQDAQLLAQLMHDLDNFPKPTIAAVQGAAFGGALGLVCCCDISIATPTASFCLSEVKLGLIPAVISPYVIRTIGSRQARRYMLTAERFDANTAQQLNIIHVVDADIDQISQSFCQQLQQNSPQALAWCKQLIHQLEDGVINGDTRQYTSEQIAKIRVSAEGQEGLSAFFEKRPATWIAQGNNHV